MPFDLAKARHDGIPDDEILQHLASSAGFNVEAALKDGKTKGQILAHLAENAQPPREPLNAGKVIKSALPGIFGDQPANFFGMGPVVPKIQRNAKGELDVAPTELPNEPRRANDSLMSAAEDIGAGNYGESMRHAVGAIPMAGGITNAIADAAESGHPSEALGTALGAAGMVAGPYAAEKGAGLVGKGMKWAGRKMYDSALPSTPSKFKNESAADIRARRESNIDYGLRKDINLGRDVTTSGPGSADAQLAETGKQIGAITAGDTDHVPHALSDMVGAARKVENRALPSDKPFAEEVRGGLSDEFRNGPGQIPRNPSYDELQDLKTRYQSRAYDNARPGEGVRKQTQAAIANAARDALVQKYPFLEDLYGDYSQGLDFQKNTKVLGKGQDAGRGNILKRGLLDAAAGVVGGALGLPGGPAGVGAGAMAGTVLRDYLSRPGVKSSLALEIWKRGGKLQSWADARGPIMDQLGEMARRGAAGMSIEHTNDIGQVIDLPTPAKHIATLGAAIDHAYGDLSLPMWKARMKQEFGPKVFELPNGKSLDPTKVYAAKDAIKAQLADESASVGKSIRSFADQRGHTDIGIARGGENWHSANMQELANEYGAENVQKLIRMESATSPRQAVPLSMEQAVAALKELSAGRAPKPDLFRENLMAKAAADQPFIDEGDLGYPSKHGKKVGNYDADKLSEIGASPGANWTTVDGLMQDESGFPTGGKRKLPDGTVENLPSASDTALRFIDAVNRIEARQRGLKVKQNQAARWVGYKTTTQGRGGVVLEGAEPWADIARQKLEAAGGKSEVFPETDFGFGANEAPQSPLRHARAARDLEHNGGFTLTPSGKPYTSGYSYSPTKAAEMRLDRALTAKDIAAYEYKHRATLRRFGGNVGGWKSGDARVLDVSVHTPDLYDALTKAGEADQDAIYDHAMNREIPVKGAIATVVRLTDGRNLVSESVKHADARRLPTHLSLIEKAGVDPSQVADTGWIINGKYSEGGGGTVKPDAGAFTLGEYEQQKAARAKALARE